MACRRAAGFEHYATLFDTVEVNSTFYRLASSDAVARWVQSTPPEFVFALKASGYLTHVKRLRDIGAGVQRFYAAIAPLVGTPKLGPVLWQLPERFERDDERLEGALRTLPAGRHCFEFRHPSWFADDVYALLREHRAALVIGDHSQRLVGELTDRADAGPASTTIETFDRRPPQGNPYDPAPLLIVGGPHFDRGRAAPPDAPGLGFDLDWERFERADTA